MVTQRFVYDDPERPLRATSAIQSPPYVVEDQALLTGLDLYEQSLCRCGHPKAVAWHADMDGWFEEDTYVCHACSVGREPDDKAIYRHVRSTRPDDRPLPPFLLGVTTTSS